MSSSFVLGSGSHSEVEQAQPYQIFINSLRTAATRKQYRGSLLRYMAHYKIHNVSQLLSMPTKETEQMLIKYIIFLRDNNKSYELISSTLAGLMRFYTINDYALNKSKISLFKGVNEKKYEDRAYTHEEISRLLNVSPLRMKVVFLLLCTSGIRIGALPFLKLKHCEKIELEKQGNLYLYKIHVYVNDRKAHYYTLTTPEFAATLDTYLEYRTRNFESLGPESPLIRNEFNINNEISRDVKPLHATSYNKLIWSYLVKAGLREVDHTSRHNRKEVMACHGMRKFTETQLINAGVNPMAVKRFMGHSCSGLEDRYFRPSSDFLLNEYCKGIDLLTISESNRLKRKVHELTDKQDELALMRLKHDKEIEAMRNDQKSLIQTLINEGVLKPTTAKK